jgi:hypothetical protein
MRVRGAVAYAGGLAVICGSPTVSNAPQASIIALLGVFLMVLGALALIETLEGWIQTPDGHGRMSGKEQG